MLPIADTMNNVLIYTVVTCYIITDWAYFTAVLFRNRLFLCISISFAFEHQKRVARLLKILSLRSINIIIIGATVKSEPLLPKYSSPLTPILSHHTTNSTDQCLQSWSFTLQFPLGSVLNSLLAFILIKFIISLK